MTHIFSYILYTTVNNVLISYMTKHSQVLYILCLQLHWRVYVQPLLYSTTLEGQGGRWRDANQASPSQQMQGSATGQVSTL